MHRRIFLTSLAVFAAVLLAASTAHGASPDLVVSELFAGGGNAGASFTNDYVALFNRGSASIDLTGWSIQYATATGTTWSPTALTGTIAPGRTYLVQLASTGAIGAPLPAPDATGTTNLSTSGGKVALVHDTAALACGASPGSCSAVVAVRDFVGYGSATDFEAAAAPALTNSTAATRAGGGCVDTDMNTTDFAAAAPAPRNVSAAAAACGGAAPTAGQGANVSVDVQPVISLTLERATVNFGVVATGESPAAVAERVTVVSTHASGYALSVRRAAFTPADLPLGISAAPPPGAQFQAALAGGAVVAVPTTTDLLLGTSSAASAAAGDVWPTSLAFASPLPVVAPGHYSSTITYTVIGR